MQVQRSRPRVRARQPTAPRAGQIVTLPVIPDPEDVPIIGDWFGNGGEDPPFPPELLAIGGGLLLLLLLVALLG